MIYKLECEKLKKFNNFKFVKEIEFNFTLSIFDILIAGIRFLCFYCKHTVALLN